MRHRIHRQAILLAFILTLLGQALTAPSPLGSSTTTSYRRRAPGNTFTQTVVTQTVQTIVTNAGPVTETCTITLTPVSGPNGEPLVQEVQACTQAPGAAPPPPSEPQSASSSSSSPPSATTTSTETSPSPAALENPSAASAASSVALSSTTPVSSPPSSVQTVTSSPAPSLSSAGVSVVGLSSVPIPTSTVTSTTPSTTSSQTSPSAAKDVTTSAKSTSTSSGSSAVTVADNASTTPSPSSSAESAFQIPGKKISVLPIGLGIFAGISVIALIVVGLVTYERTKYRKIFRQRKLAEQGAGLGYGGVAP
ncbi:hypothetical protein BJV74DRAFT_877589 [Russula compacta]|nr:hypothetical protein BJV74DRAFT_877589 [Russula compacta]